MRKPAHRKRVIAFTLVEMLVVMAIIALLAGLVAPSYQNALQRARSIKCAGNLRAIGTAAALYATDNNNKYPEIDQAGGPIYSDGKATNIIGAFTPYGITTNMTQCPVDMEASPNSFTKYGSSYEWDPVFDNEPVNETVVYITPTVAIPVNSSRVRLAMDFTPIHNGRPNVVYGDGHVASH
jgi:prepilin-type N-terminal cleavage/methylation domain-containing protein/prepilin-type processing-associated H-X9-DG protein